MSGARHAKLSRVRLFFALWPDTRARAALSQLAEEIARDGQGRAAPPANVHVTLAFLGEVPASRLDALIAIGSAAAGSAPPFPLALERIGGGRFDIAWLAPSSVPESLRRLQATLNEALVSASFPTQQRMFRPHVTLARDCSRPAHRGRVAAIEWQVQTLALVKSTPAPGGSRYRDVGNWPLAGA